MNKQILNIIKSFYQENPYYLVTTTLFIGLTPLNDIYLSRLYGNMFESVQTNSFKMEHFFKVLSVIIFLQIAYALMDLNDSKQIPLFQIRCKKIFIESIFKRNEENYKELLTGELQSKIIRSENVITSWFSKLGTIIVPHVFEFIFTLGYFFWIDPILGVSFGILLAIFSYFIYTAPESASSTTVQSDKALGDIREQIDDVLTNYLTIHKEDKLQDELKILETKGSIFTELYHKSVKKALSHRFILIFFLCVFLIIFVNICFRKLNDKSLSKSLFFSLIMMLGHFISNLLWMIDLGRDAIFDFGTIRNSEFLKDDYQKGNGNIKDNCLSNTKKGSLIPVLEARNIYFKYQDQRSWVLNNVNLKINKGDKLIITGEIGSGKSSLLKLFTRLMKPQKGHFLLNGQCYSEFNIKSFYKKVGCMPQNCVLFNRSILDNIRYGNEKTITIEGVTALLHKFGIMKHFSKLKDGIHSSAGKNGSNLSGGQKQLIWFIKLYIKNPDIIFMDEPTASLDKVTKDLFKEIMYTLLGDKTIVIISHDPYLLNLSKNTIVIEKGTILR
jgi:ABC-type multidrug transport system fused ATPase/permease subunit